VTVSGSTFARNTATDGGGIFNAASITVTRRGTNISFGTMTVSDSTFTGNVASHDGGGIDNFGTAVVTGSTFRHNSAGSGNGGLNNEAGGGLTQFDNEFINKQQPDVFP
jgi:hypothetical protein